MIELYEGSIETVLSIALVCMHGKAHRLIRCGSGKRIIDQRKETTMQGRPESPRTVNAARCDGKFGLVRHSSWRTPLCSQKRIDRFKTRRESDRSWLPRVRIALNPLLENRERVS
jgi:hypothetical protein